MKEEKKTQRREFTYKRHSISCVVVVAIRCWVLRHALLLILSEFSGYFFFTFQL